MSSGIKIHPKYGHLYMVPILIKITIFKKSIIDCKCSATMFLSNVISNHHVQYNGMFTITTHFMAKHMLEDNEMLKKGLAGKGLIVSTFLLLFVNKITLLSVFFSAPKVLLFVKWVLFFAKNVLFFPWKGAFFKYFFLP